MQKERLPITAADTNGEVLLTFGVDVRANSVVAVQVPLGGETDVLAAELHAMEERVRSCEHRLTE